MKISLSYVLTTCNKLPYLKVTLPYLIQNCTEDEEIVVVDGNSFDGTKEYLQELYNNKKIHRLISEKDYGEAHGYNKAICLAKGELIKIISDDDFYDFEEIKKCKEFMIQNPEYDVLASNTIQVNLTNATKVECFYSKNLELDFVDWTNKKRPNTFFTGLTLMLRKSSIPLIGLFNNYFKMVDIEYCVRITSLKTNIAYYTKPLVVSTINSASNSVMFFEKHERELIKVSFSYEYFNSFLSKQVYYNPYSIKQSFLNLLYMFVSKIFSKNKQYNVPQKIDSKKLHTFNVENFNDVANACLKFLHQYNQTNEGLFILKNNS
ncbi:MAG: glycosyltransferase [Bacteroidetes bacterium]|nr:glycosyltransferase [Bacteroidota bacterium]